MPEISQPESLPTIDTIADLLDNAGTQWRVYDLGRRIDKLSQDTFRLIESTALPYPSPIQNKAFFAIVFWSEGQSHTPYLWFLQFHLDEQSRIIQAERNHFLSLVLQALGTNLTNTNEKQAEALNNNPYTFKPNQYKLALVNSLIKATLHQPPSQFYQPVQAYLSDTTSLQTWDHLGIQGLADFAVWINADKNTDLLSQALMQLPQQMLDSLALVLENVSLPTSLAEKVAWAANKALDEQKNDRLCALLRMLSASKGSGFRTQLIDRIFSGNEIVDIQVLIAIAGRCWLDLTDAPRRMKYLEALAASPEGSACFKNVISDLVAIPAIRDGLLSDFRNPNRSAALSTAIGHLFQTPTPQP